MNFEYEIAIEIELIGITKGSRLHFIYRNEIELKINAFLELRIPFIHIIFLQ